MIITVCIPDWYRGKGCDGSALLTEEERQRCCLGFFGQRVGAKDFQLLKIETPAGLARDTGIVMPGMTEESSIPFSPFKCTQECMEMMVNNDDEEITDETRIQRLKDAAKKMGHTFLFVESRLLARVINLGLYYIGKVVPFIQ